MTNHIPKYPPAHTNAASPRLRRHSSVTAGAGIERRATCSASPAYLGRKTSSTYATASALMCVRSRQMYVLAARRGTHADSGNRASSLPSPPPCCCRPPPGEHTLPPARRAGDVRPPAGVQAILTVPAREVEHREEARTSEQAPPPRPIAAQSPPFWLGTYLIDRSLPLACVRGRADVAAPRAAAVCSDWFSRRLRRAGPPGGRARPLTACR